MDLPSFRRMVDPEPRLPEEANPDGDDDSASAPGPSAKALAMRTAFVAYCRGHDWRPMLPPAVGSPPPAGTTTAAAAAGLYAFPSATGGLYASPSASIFSTDGHPAGGGGGGMGLNHWMRLWSDLGLLEIQGGPVAGALLQTVHGAYRPHNSPKLGYLGFVQAVAALSAQLRYDLVVPVCAHGASLLAAQRHQWRLQQLSQLQVHQLHALKSSRPHRPSLAETDEDMPDGSLELSPLEEAKEAASLAEMQDLIAQPPPARDSGAPEGVLDIGTWVPRKPPPPPPPVIIPPELTASMTQQPPLQHASPPATSPRVPHPAGRPQAGMSSPGNGSPGRAPRGHDGEPAGRAGGRGSVSGGGGNGSGAKSPTRPDGSKASQQQPQQQSQQQAPKPAGAWLRASADAATAANGAGGAVHPYLQGLPRSKQYAPKLRPLRHCPPIGDPGDHKAYLESPQQPHGLPGGGGSRTDPWIVSGDTAAVGGSGGSGGDDPDSQSSPFMRTARGRTGAGGGGASEPSSDASGAFPMTSDCFTGSRSSMGPGPVSRGRGTDPSGLPAVRLPAVSGASRLIAEAGDNGSGAMPPQTTVGLESRDSGSTAGALPSAWGALGSRSRRGLGIASLPPGVYAIAAAAGGGSDSEAVTAGGAGGGSATATAASLTARVERLERSAVSQEARMAQLGSRVQSAEAATEAESEQNRRALDELAVSIVQHFEARQAFLESHLLDQQQQLVAAIQAVRAARDEAARSREEAAVSKKEATVAREQATAAATAAAAVAAGVAATAAAAAVTAAAPPQRAVAATADVAAAKPAVVENTAPSARAEPPAALQSLAPVREGMQSETNAVAAAATPTGAAPSASGAKAEEERAAAAAAATAAAAAMSAEALATAAAEATEKVMGPARTELDELLRTVAHQQCKLDEQLGSLLAQQQALLLDAARVTAEAVAAAEAARLAALPAPTPAIVATTAVEPTADAVVVATVMGAGGYDDGLGSSEVSGLVSQLARELEQLRAQVATVVAARMADSGILSAAAVAKGQGIETAAQAAADGTPASNGAVLTRDVTAAPLLACPEAAALRVMLEQLQIELASMRVAGGTEKQAAVGAAEEEGWKEGGGNGDRRAVSGGGTATTLAPDGSAGVVVGVNAGASAVVPDPEVASAVETDDATKREAHDGAAKRGSDFGTGSGASGHNGGCSQCGCRTCVTYGELQRTTETLRNELASQHDELSSRLAAALKEVAVAAAVEAAAAARAGGAAAHRSSSAQVDEDGVTAEAVAAGATGGALSDAATAAAAAGTADVASLAAAVARLDAQLRELQQRVEVGAGAATVGALEAAGEGHSVLAGVKGPARQLQSPGTPRGGAGGVSTGMEDAGGAGGGDGSSAAPALRRCSDGEASGAGQAGMALGTDPRVTTETAATSEGASRQAPPLHGSAVGLAAAGPAATAESAAGSDTGGGDSGSDEAVGTVRIPADSSQVAALAAALAAVQNRVDALEAAAVSSDGVATAAVATAIGSSAAAGAGADTVPSPPQPSASASAPTVEELQRQFDSLVAEVRQIVDQLSASLTLHMDEARTEIAVLVATEVASQASRVGSTTPSTHASKGGGAGDVVVTGEFVRALQERLTAAEAEVEDVSRAADMTTESVELLTKHLQAVERAQRETALKVADIQGQAATPSATGPASGPSAAEAGYEDPTRPSSQPSDATPQASTNTASPAETAIANDPALAALPTEVQVWLQALCGQMEALDSLVREQEHGLDVLAQVAEAASNSSRLAATRLDVIEASLADVSAAVFDTPLGERRSAPGSAAARWGPSGSGTRSALRTPEEAEPSSGGGDEIGTPTRSRPSGGVHRGGVSFSGEVELAETREAVAAVAGRLIDAERGLEVRGAAMAALSQQMDGIVQRLEGMESRLADVAMDSAAAAAAAVTATATAAAAVVTSRGGGGGGGGPADLGGNGDSDSEDEETDEEEYEESPDSYGAHEVVGVAGRSSSGGGGGAEVMQNAGAAVAVAAAAAGGGIGPFAGALIELDAELQARLKAAIKVLQGQIQTDRERSQSEVSELHRGVAKLREKSTLIDEIIVKLARRLDTLFKRVQAMLDADEAEAMTTYSVIDRDRLGATSRGGGGGGRGDLGRMDSVRSDYQAGLDGFSAPPSQAVSRTNSDTRGGD